jgi:hypothetical protein
MVGLILLTKLIFMIHFYGQLVLLNVNLGMSALGIKPTQLLTSIKETTRMQQITLISSQTTKQLHKYTWVALAHTISKITMDLIVHLQHF